MVEKVESVDRLGQNPVVGAKESSEPTGARRGANNQPRASSYKSESRNHKFAKRSQWLETLIPALHEIIQM